MGPGGPPRSRHSRRQGTRNTGHSRPDPLPNHIGRGPPAATPGLQALGFPGRTPSGPPTSLSWEGPPHAIIGHCRSHHRTHGVQSPKGEGPYVLKPCPTPRMHKSSMEGPGPALYVIRHLRVTIRQPVATRGPLPPRVLIPGYLGPYREGGPSGQRNRRGPP